MLKQIYDEVKNASLAGTSKKNIKKLQVAQNFSARILTKTRKFGHISPILNKPGWLTAKQLLEVRDAVMIFKCLNNQATLYLSDKLSFRHSIHNHNTRNNNQINILHCRTATAQSSFFYRAPKLFNSLSPELKQIKSAKLFKPKLKSLIPNL